MKLVFGAMSKNYVYIFMVSTTCILESLTTRFDNQHEKKNVVFVMSTMMIPIEFQIYVNGLI